MIKTKWAWIALGCIFLFSGAAYSGTYDGLWIGTTDNGNDVIFKVVNDAVRSFSVISQSGTSSYSSSPGYSITNNAFNIPDSYTGTFTNTNCNGTWKNSDGSLNGTWSANKSGSCNCTGIYTEEQMNRMVQNILTWGDTDGDGKIGLSEVIHGLRVISGVSQP